MKHNDKKVKNEKIKKPNFAKANFLKINNYLNDVDWDNILNEKDVNESWKIISNEIEFVLQNFVPTKFISSNKIKSNHISIDDSLHFLLKQKRIFFKI